mgnify:CR=1 FL=1
MLATEMVYFTVFFSKKKRGQLQNGQQEKHVPITKNIFEGILQWTIVG